MARTAKQIVALAGGTGNELAPEIKRCGHAGGAIYYAITHGIYEGLPMRGNLVGKKVYCLVVIQYHPDKPTMAMQKKGKKQIEVQVEHDSAEVLREWCEVSDNYDDVTRQLETIKICHSVIGMSEEELAELEKEKTKVITKIKREEKQDEEIYGIRPWRP